MSDPRSHPLHRTLAGQLLATAFLASYLFAPRGAWALGASKPAPARKTTATHHPAAAESALPGDLVRLEIAPAAIALDGRRAVQRLVVTAVAKDGATCDVTDRVALNAAGPRVVRIASGTLSPLSNGETRIVARLGRLASSPVPVTVRSVEAPVSTEFVNDVMPILAKTGCNSTACHGSPAGKGGLKLSLFGYEPELDHPALVKDQNGKRVNLKNPEQSLLLQKSTMEVPHAGGQRFKPDSREYRTFLAWLKEGAPGIGEFEARVRGIEVLPASPWMPAPGSHQRLVVQARMSDGSVRDVTERALFASNDDAVAAVDSEGRVTAKRAGETAVTVRFLGQAAVSRVAVLPPWKLPESLNVARHNFIDELVQAKLKKLRMAPSAPCTDEEFIRRATLDVCGIIPTPEEVRAFVAECEAERAGTHHGDTETRSGGERSAVGSQQSAGRAEPPNAQGPRPKAQGPPPTARARLIDRLLDRPEFVDLWTMKWNDILRNNPKVTKAGLADYSNWIREQIAGNRPYDQFVRELITAEGSPTRVNVASAEGAETAPAEAGALPNSKRAQRLLEMLKTLQAQDPKRAQKLARRLAVLGISAPAAKTAPQNPKKVRRAAPVEDGDATRFSPAANYFIVSKDPLDVTSATSQIFLGVRIECARCHNHPFEKWTQNDYYGLAAFFNGIRAKGNKKVGQVVTFNPGAPPLRHPKTNEVIEPKTLDGAEAKLERGADRRAALAEWITSSENPYFAKALVNRLWGHYFGKGIIDPIDDVRVTNPASNPELLDALAKEFVAGKFDVKAIHRLILNSVTYQQSSRTNQYNAQDTRNFARFYPKRLMAEQLYDSISQATGVFISAGGGRRAGKKATGGKYGAPVAEGTARVMQLSTQVVAGTKQVGGLSQFLDTFGKPRRAVACECERSSDGNINQALALLNGDEVNDKIAAPAGRVQQFIRSGKPDTAVIAEIYEAALSRRPTQKEQDEAAALIRSSKSRGEGIEDLMWSLLNSREFLFIH